MRIPGLGPVEADADEESWYVSSPLAVPVLGGALCRIVVEGYDDDERPEDFHETIRTFLALDPSVLAAASPAIFAYYRDVVDSLDASGDESPRVEIAGPDDVLDHVQLGDEPTLTREDQHVYVSLECECVWEPEHGLQIVFRDGREVTRVGPYDGQLTNLDDVVYHSNVWPGQHRGTSVPPRPTG